MSSTLLHSIELVAGLIALCLATITWRPMKRYFAKSTIARNDEFLVIIWIAIAIFGGTMVVYGLA
jgi:hypothetical protein